MVAARGGLQEGGYWWGVGGYWMVAIEGWLAMSGWRGNMEGGDYRLNGGGLRGGGWLGASVEIAAGGGGWWLAGRLSWPRPAISRAKH